MRSVKIRPFVPSGSDYPLAQRFFEDLGFKKVYADDGLSIFQNDEQEFFLQNFNNQEFQDNFMLELRVEHLDDVWRHIQDTELEKKYPIRAKAPEVYPWGSREIHLIDPAGVCWHISESVKE